MNVERITPLLQGIAQAVDVTLKAEAEPDETIGFTLLLWTSSMTGGKGAHYVSNCEREDVIKALRETADRLERQMLPHGEDI